MADRLTAAGPQVIRAAPEIHQGTTFGALVLRAVRRYPDRTAIVCGSSEITYREMGEQIARFKHVLGEAGVTPGTGVCILMSNRPEAICLRMAVHLTGARYAALNPLASAADHRFIVEDSETDFLVVEERFAASIPALTAGGGVRRTFILGNGTADDFATLAAACRPAPLRCDAAPDGIAALTYTGGTTGRPKGVIQSHRALVTNVLMCLAEWDWPKRPCILLMTPLSHAAGLLTVPVFVKGGSVHLSDGFDPARFIGIVAQERISATFLVPTMIHAIVNYAGVQAAALASLELVIYGASPISPSLLAEAMALFGPVFMQLYAQTEAPMTVTTLNIDDHEGDPAWRLSCGFPMVGADVRLLDDDCNEVATGEVGEICVRGPVVADGYWKRPEETEASFRGGWLHTGDLARADAAGYLFIVDRKKDMIISGGFNVYPKEVEDALSSHPDVAQAAVFGVPDARWGEAVKAAVVPRPGRTPDAAELIAFVRELKGAVCAPKSIDLCDAMPVTPVGKPDKQALRAPYWRDAARNVS